MELSVSGSVYSPAEDSFLLAKHSVTLKGRILDFGCGSGIQALANAKANPSNEVIGVDINPEAVACATGNAKRNKIRNARFVVSDLFGSLNGMEGKFDGIIFNPPYLPDIESESKFVLRAELALGGGITGREITNRFLGEFDAYLNGSGVLLLLQSSINGIDETIRKLEEKGFAAEIVSQESFFFEKLYVLKAGKA